MMQHYKCFANIFKGKDDELTLYESSLMSRLLNSSVLDTLFREMLVEAVEKRPEKYNSFP